MKTDSSDCEKCGGTLYIIDGVTYDRDGMRSARYCAECHTLYGCYSHGLGIVAEGVDMSELKHQNSMLRNTLRTVLGLYPETPAKGAAMPQTREFWEKRAMMDQDLIIKQRTRIGSLMNKSNTLATKLEAMKQRYYKALK